MRNVWILRDHARGGRQDVLPAVLVVEETFDVGDPDAKRIIDRAEDYLTREIPIPKSLFDLRPIDSPPIPYLIPRPGPLRVPGTPAPSFGVPFIICFTCDTIFILNQDRFGPDIQG